MFGDWLKLSESSLHIWMNNNNNYNPYFLWVGKMFYFLVGKNVLLPSWVKWKIIFWQAQNLSKASVILRDGFFPLLEHLLKGHLTINPEFLADLWSNSLIFWGTKFTIFSLPITAAKLSTSFFAESHHYRWILRSVLRYVKNLLAAQKCHESCNDAWSNIKIIATSSSQHAGDQTDYAPKN